MDLLIGRFCDMTHQHSNLSTFTLSTVLITLLISILFQIFLLPNQFGHSLPYNSTLHSKHSRHVNLTYGKTFYTLKGPSTSELIVLIHGIRVDSSMWSVVQEELVQKNFRVLSYDLYGTGYSTAPNAKYDETLFVKQLVDLLYQLQETSVHLVGYSLGGGIASKFASLFSEKVKSLTLISTVGLSVDVPFKLLVHIPVVSDLLFGQTRYAHYRVLEAIPDMFANITRDAKKAIELFEKTDEQFLKNPSFAAALLQTLRDFPIRRMRSVFEDIGKSYSFPVLLLWGSNDTITPVKNVNELQQLIPRAESKIVDFAGHAILYEEPMQVAEAICNFVTNSR